MKPIALLIALILAAAVPRGAATANETPAAAKAEAEEPTHEVCLEEVAKARALAEALPEGHPSRHFALTDLHQALVEDGNGEYDDCVELAERATIEVRERRHFLHPGESLFGQSIDR